MCTSSQNSDTEITSTTTKTSSKSTKNNDSVKSINSNSHSTSTIIINKFNMLTSTTTASANQYLRPEYLPPVSSPVSFFFLLLLLAIFFNNKKKSKSIWSFCVSCSNLTVSFCFYVFQKNNNLLLFSKRFIMFDSSSRFIQRLSHFVEFVVF